MVKIKKSHMRVAARKSLEEEGYAVREKTGRGIMPGARLVATKRNVEYSVAVRTSLDRTVGFSVNPEGKWRTLNNVDAVLVAAFAEDDLQTVEIFKFESKALIKRFDRALEQLKIAGKVAVGELPVFIPLDDHTKKNLGHQVFGLKRTAQNVYTFEPKQMAALVSIGGRENFIDRVRREFAEINEVDVARVVVEFRILS